VVSDGRVVNQVGVSDGSKELLLRSLHKVTNWSALCEQQLLKGKKTETPIRANYLHIVEGIHSS